MGPLAKIRVDGVAVAQVTKESNSHRTTEKSLIIPAESGSLPLELTQRFRLASVDVTQSQDLSVQSDVEWCMPQMAFNRSEVIVRCRFRIDKNLLSHINQTGGATAMLSLVGPGESVAAFEIKIKVTRESPFRVAVLNGESQGRTSIKVHDETCSTDKQWRLKKVVSREVELTTEITKADDHWVAVIETGSAIGRLVPITCVLEHDVHPPIYTSAFVKL